MSDEPLLKVNRVGKRFPGVVALDGVDLDVEPSRVLGLLGANGSGKSTLSRIIAGEIAPDAGSLRLRGDPVVFASPHDAARRGIVIAHQHPSLAPDLPVWENLFLGAEQCRPGGFIARRESRRRAAAILEELGASWVDTNAPAGQLSAAGQQLTEIARALLRAPRLLILDEPTAALGVADVARLFAAVRRLTESATAVIFISHRLQEVEALCDRVAVLRRGTLIDLGTLEQLRRLSALQVQISFAGSPPDLSDVPGVTDLTVHHGTVRLQLRGPVEPLLQAIAGHPVRQLLSEEPSLEQLFLAEYGTPASRHVA